MVRTEDKALAASIGARARALRKARGATQEQVAEWVGLAAQVYSRLERGEMLPSLRTLVRLAEALAVSPTEFFGDFVGPVLRDQGAEYAAKTRPRTRRAKPEISSSFMQLDPSTQALVLALVRHLARQKR